MSRQYQAGLCDCCSPFDLCMKTTFCPCVTFGRNHHRLTHGTDEGYSTCNAWCVGWCCLLHVGHFGWILQLLDRQDMQDQHNLEGGFCGNCLKTWCCTCCELIQTNKELGYIQAEKSEQGYQSQPGMVAQPQQ